MMGGDIASELGKGGQPTALQTSRVRTTAGSGAED